MGGTTIDHQTTDLARRVVLCLNDRDLNSRLRDGLERAGYVASESSLDELDLEATDGEPVVLVTDDSSCDWLRRVSDLLDGHPHVRPLLMLSSDNADGFLSAISAGISGFCAVDADVEAVVRTVESLRSSGVAIPRGMVAPLVEQVRHGRGRRVQSAAGPIDVTDREWQILQLLLQRHSTKEMAEALFVSVGTVRSHVSALLRKLGAVDREDAISMIERARRT
jgi:two-component system nitrate/nitrite response regulator NarL